MSVRKGQARLRKLAHTLTALPSSSEDTTRARLPCNGFTSPWQR